MDILQQSHIDKEIAYMRHIDRLTAKNTTLEHKLIVYRRIVADLYHSKN